ncbi:MAG: ChaN family lipoprotein [Hylemonella sp.]
MLRPILIHLACLCCCILPLSGCHTNPRLPAGTAQGLASLGPADVLLLGEQHDASDHHRLQAEVVMHLTSQGRLAALALEMAEQGRHTRDLPRHAEPAQVRDALGWSDSAWPWTQYEAAVMAAVKAGVPVLGANLPRKQMGLAMNNPELDRLLSPAALKMQSERIRDGHCGQLAESRIPAMVRIQIARDLAMAQTLEPAVRPDQTVVLLAGRGHVDRSVGVPLHLPSGLRVRAVALGMNRHEEAHTNSIQFDAFWPAAPAPPTDYCAQFKRSGASRSTPSPAPPVNPR